MPQVRELGVNTHTRRIVDPSDEYNAPSASALLRLFYGEEVVIGCSFTDQDNNPITGWAGNDAFEMAVDVDFTHTTLDGTLNVGYSGAVTSIVVDYSVDPGNDLDTEGYLILQNSSNERESIAYTAISGSGTQRTFTVSATLTYTYVAGDTASIADNLMAYAGNDKVDIAGDWSEIDRANGKVSFRLDCNRYEFLRKILENGLDNNNNLSVFLEIKRYAEGEDFPTVLCQDSVNARNVVRDLEFSSPELPIVPDNRYQQVYANLVELAEDPATTDFFDIYDTSTGTQKKLSASRVITGGASLTTQYRMVYVDGPGAIAESTNIITDAAGKLLIGTPTAYSGETLGVNGAVYVNNGDFVVKRTDTGTQFLVEGTVFSDMIINASSINSDASVSLQSEGTTRWRIFNDASASHPLIFEDTDAATERMRISSAGYVLVNTASRYSGEQFAVNGGAYVNGAIEIGQSTDIGGAGKITHFTTNNFLYVSGGSAGTIIQNSTATNVFKIDAAQNALTFETSATERMRINSSGQVLIGTSSPYVSEKLGVNGDIYANGAVYSDALRLDTSAGAPGHAAGVIFWDSTNDCPAYYNSEADVTNQIGQEVWVRFKNNTGSTITNGSVVYVNGVDGAIPTCDLADASSAATSLSTIAVATHDVETGTIGLATRIGTVRDVNTAGCTAGQVLYLSATTPGTWTTTQPDSPNYSVRIGTCTVINASTGSIEVQLAVGDNIGGIIKIFNGQSFEPTSISVTSNGTTITLSLEKEGGGDLNLFFNGGFSTFDATPAATVSLTAGTDTDPILNYIFIPESTMVLTANTTGFPTAQHVPVATVLCQSAATLQTDGTDGAYKIHQWSEDLVDGNDQGHITHINSWIRSQNATWKSGVDPSFSGSGTGTINMSATSGSVNQLHDQTIPTTSSPASFNVVNDNTTPYNSITNLGGGILSDSTGGSLANSTYALVVWATANANGNVRWYVNLPGGSYGSAAAARTDAQGHTNYTIPAEFKGTGFLVHRLIVSTNPSQTTFTIDATGNDDLRGQIPSTIAGGGTAGSGLPAGVQGDVLYHNGSIWTTLVAGTSGQILQTQGSGANPQWATVAGATPDKLGQYNASTAYTTGQMVESGGVIWKCIQNGTGQTPAAGSAYWQEYVPNQTQTDATTSRTLAAVDKNKTIVMTNASASTLTIPTNATTAFTFSDSDPTIFPIVSTGAGGVTIQASVGVTLNGTSGGSETLTQYNRGVLYKTGTDTWVFASGGGTGGTVENIGFTEVLTDRDYEESTNNWRPIYMKTLNFGLLPNSTIKSVNHSISNLSKFVKLRGMSDDGTTSRPLGYAASTSSFIEMRATSTQVTIVTASDRSAYTGYIFMEYTKTTDTPTSSPRNT